MSEPPPDGRGEGPLDFNALFSQAQRLQQDMLSAQEQAKARIVEASAGGGMVTATVTGGGELRKLKIDPQCVDAKDLGMLEDLIVAAVNQALVRAQEQMQEEMRKLAGGLNLPPGLL